MHAPVPLRLRKGTNLLFRPYCFVQPERLSFSSLSSSCSFFPSYQFLHIPSAPSPPLLSLFLTSLLYFIMSVTMSTSGLRSPQHIKTHNVAYSSDEIQSHVVNGIPQRPPRQRHGSVSSPTMSGSQYYQHYQQQHQQQQQQQQQQYQYDSYLSSSPPSSRPSPRSSQPSSPLTFQLPPSALSSTREESLRSGSISYHPNTYNTQPIQVPQLSSSASSAASSYRTPQMTPGLNGGGGSGGLMMSMMSPLTLPESFLEEQSDYAEYYSDVGFSGTPLHQHHQLPSIQTAPILRQQHQSMEYPLSPVSVRNGQQGGFLPSPQSAPTISSLSDDFPSLALGKEEKKEEEKTGQLHEREERGGGGGVPNNWQESMLIAARFGHRKRPSDRPERQKGHRGYNRSHVPRRAAVCRSTRLQSHLIAPSELIILFFSFLCSRSFPTFSFTFAASLPLPIPRLSDNR